MSDSYDLVLEDNSTEFVVDLNDNQPGPQGIPGPNLVSLETTTSLTGVLFGDGATVSAKNPVSARAFLEVFSQAETQSAIATALTAYTPTAGLAAVALSGSASDLILGTLADARLSPNVPLRNAASNIFTGAVSFGGTVQVGGISGNVLKNTTGGVQARNSIDSAYVRFEGTGVTNQVGNLLLQAGPAWNDGSQILFQNGPTIIATMQASGTTLNVPLTASGTVRAAVGIASREATTTPLGFSSSIAFWGRGDLGLYRSVAGDGAQIYLGDSNFTSSSYWNSAPGIGAVGASPTSELAFYVYTGATNSRTEAGRFTNASQLQLSGTLKLNGASGPVVRANGVTVEIRNSANNALGPFRATEVQASGGLSVMDPTTVSQHWLIDKVAGDGALRIRDTVNSRNQMSFTPGANSDTAITSLSSRLNVGDLITAAKSISLSMSNSNSHGINIFNTNSTLGRQGKIALGWPGNYDDELLIYHGTPLAMRITDSAVTVTRTLGIQNLSGTDSAIIFSNNGNNAIQASSTGVPGLRLGALTEMRFGILSTNYLFLTSSLLTADIAARFNSTIQIGGPAGALLKFGSGQLQVRNSGDTANAVAILGALGVTDGTGGMEVIPSGAFNVVSIGSTGTATRMKVGVGGSTTALGLFSDYRANAYFIRNTSDSVIWSSDASGNVVNYGTLQIGVTAGPILRANSNSLDVRNSSNTGWERLNVLEVRGEGLSYSRFAQMATAGSWGGGYNFNLNGGVANRDSTGTVAAVWYTTTGIGWYAEPSAAAGAISPKMSLSPTRLTVNTDGQFGTQTTNGIVTILGGQTTNVACLSLLKWGNREGYIGQSTNLLCIGVSGGLGTYSDSTLQSNAAIHVADSKAVAMFGTLSVTGAVSGASFTTAGTILQEVSTNGQQTAVRIKNSNNGSAAQTRFELHNDESTTASTGAALFFCSSTFTGGFARAAGLWNHQNGPLLFATNNVERLRILGTGEVESAGNIRINTSNDLMFNRAGQVTAATGRVRWWTSGLFGNSIGPDSTDFTIVNQSVTAIRIKSAGNVDFLGHITSAFQSLSADPSTLDISSGMSRLVKNTTSGEIRHWVNDGGAMKKSPAYT